MLKYSELATSYDNSVFIQFQLLHKINKTSL